MSGQVTVSLFLPGRALQPMKEQPSGSSLQAVDLAAANLTG
jgi:hypothetical protein